MFREETLSSLEVWKFALPCVWQPLGAGGGSPQTQTQTWGKSGRLSAHHRREDPADL